MTNRICYCLDFQQFVVFLLDDFSPLELDFNDSNSKYRSLERKKKEENQSTPTDWGF